MTFLREKRRDEEEEKEENDRVLLFNREAETEANGGCCAASICGGFFLMSAISAPERDRDTEEKPNLSPHRHLLFRSPKHAMSSAQDPFYIVKEEIQESIDKLQSTFRQWENSPGDSGEHVHLTKELLALATALSGRYSKLLLLVFYLQPLKPFFLDRKVDELDKAIGVASRDPSWYGIDEVELEKRRRWTSTARTQVGNVKKTVIAGRDLNGFGSTSASGMRRELMRMPNNHQTDRSNQYAAQDDDFIQSESDRQMLLIKQQDEELDELSASVERIGGVGLTIHDELLAQEKIVDELGTEMDSTSTRLDFVQKKVAMVMKKAGVKGQIMMICFLLALFIILFVLVFFT
ncbi:hypothetical protein Pint_04090 [Pistacia integerrima]|uniref:Uncharacterized protein n=1 Tax=Pistacia integerrima TaxID=434235 RepID=A0ACC0Z7Q3_9ROSI|nr:hypothetical protein Pint_04090 [Pistacia integerrima]